jgi:hypothetical protein
MIDPANRAPAVQQANQILPGQAAAAAPAPAGGLVQRVNPGDLLSKNLQRLSLCKPLSSSQFIQILSNNAFFKDENPANMSSEDFDRYSFSFIHNMLQAQTNPEVFESCRGYMETIFNQRLSGKQISRHLNNLFTFLYLFSCKDIFRLEFARDGIEFKPSEIIAAQISLVSVKTLMKGAEWAENRQDQRFLQHLWQFLQLENERTDTIVPKKGKGPDKIDLFSDLRSWMLSDDMIAKEPPCSLFEAGSVNSALQMKYLQGPSTMAFAMALALGPVTGGYSLLAFAIPPMMTLAAKVYKGFLSAPVHLRPLSDSRRLDLSCTKTFIGRDDIFKDIVGIWRAGRQPLLVGPPGVGKTAIMEAIARKIATGAIPGFINKVVFAGSAADLTSQNMMGTPHLQRVVQEILPHRENVVLALDEFHAFVQATDKTLMTLVRSILDGSNHSLKYCIFATTTEEYEKHIKQDESLERRLQVIHIKPLDKDNLLQMLHIDAEQISPLISVSGEAMERVYDKSNALQNQSRLFLRDVLRSAEASNTSHQAFRNRELKKAEIDRHKLLQRSPSNSLEVSNQFSDAVFDGREQLAKIEMECTAQEEMRSRFILLKQNLIKMSKDINTVAKELYAYVNKFSGPDASDATKIGALTNQEFVLKYNEQLKSVMFRRYFEMTNLTAFVRTYAQIFELIDVIDANFVNKVWDNRLAAAAVAALPAPAAANALAAPDAAANAPVGGAQAVPVVAVPVPDAA